VEMTRRAVEVIARPVRRAHQRLVITERAHDHESHAATSIRPTSATARLGASPCSTPCDDSRRLKDRRSLKNCHKRTSPSGTRSHLCTRIAQIENGQCRSPSRRAAATASAGATSRDSEAHARSASAASPKAGREVNPLLITSHGRRKAFYQLS
jgi:hypothetical protein